MKRTRLVGRGSVCGLCPRGGREAPVSDGASPYRLERRSMVEQILLVVVVLIGANRGGGGAAFDQGDKVSRGGLNAGDIFLGDRRGLIELLAHLFEA